MVKRLRHRPFTAVSRVRIPVGSPLWAVSSAGRASALQAGGHRFEPCTAHHIDCTNKICGSGSVVEHRLAKARVASSSLVFRSIKTQNISEFYLYASLAQLDRAFGYGPKGQGFESSMTRHNGNEVLPC